jgi:hypothetical protein
MKNTFRVTLPNANKTVYPTDVLRKMVADAQEKIRQRRLIGQIEPPNDGKTHMQFASHVVTDMRVDERGDVIADLEFLDTGAGKIVVANLEAGSPMHVIMRASGCVTRGVVDDMDIIGLDIAPGLAPREDAIELLAKLAEEDEDAGNQA